MLGNEKSETDLRKMIEIMEESLKIEKNEKISLTCAAIRGKEQKAKKTFHVLCSILFLCAHLQGNIARCPLPISMTFLPIDSI